MAEPTPIIQTNPGAAYRAQRAQIDAAIRRVMEGGWYILGKEVEAFEKEFAAFVGVGHGVGVASGTDALELALRAMDIGVGDAVLTVSHTAVATVAAIERAGATPVLVDIDPATYTMDPRKLEETLEKSGDFAPTRPRAVIPVHLYGHPADLDAIMSIARRHGLRVIEDCAQAHGAKIGSRVVGAIGDAGAFSFYPTKNLGAFGDGGMVVTGDAALASSLRCLREYGWGERYVSARAGVNSRLDELHAAMLRVRLHALNTDNQRRAAIARIFDTSLAGTGLGLPVTFPGVTHVYHQYVVRSKRRDALRDHLRKQGVGTGIHYPVPVHQQPAYTQVACPAGLKYSECAAKEVLSLPMYAQLTDEQVRRIADACAAWRE